MCMNLWSDRSSFHVIEMETLCVVQGVHEYVNSNIIYLLRWSL